MVQDPPAVSPAIKVVHLQRRAVPGVFSVENLFNDVREAMPADVDIDLRKNKHASRGIVGRIADAVTARRERGSVNHILGDVHYLAWLLPRRGTVITVLDCVSLDRLKGARKAALWLLWYWLPLRHAEHVTVISEYTRDSLLSWVKYPAERIHVIHPPVSPVFARSPLPARGERFRLLHVGVTANKNLPRLIEAVAGLPVTLVIVGKLDADIRAQLAAADVTYENYFNLALPALVEQYHRADALAFVSTYEGFGLPIIEAQAVGRPVITSNVCSMPEASGGAALLVDPRDVSAIRRAVQRLIDEPALAQQLVERGVANAALYTRERIAAEYAALYRLMSDTHA